MSAQIAISFETVSNITTPKYGPFMSIDDKFKLFHDANPQVLRAIIEICRYLKRHSKHRCGMKAIWEQLRWHAWLQTTTDEGDFKLPNEFTACYARLVMQRHSWEFGEHAERGPMFVLRKRTAGKEVL